MTEKWTDFVDDSCPTRLHKMYLAQVWGLAKKSKIQKSEFSLEVGGWISLGIFFGKSSQNSSKPVLICCSSIPCVFCLYALLKVVSYCDLRICVHGSDGFPHKKVWMCCELYPSLFCIFGFFLTLQSPLVKHTCILSHVFSNPASSEEENRGKNTGVCHSRTSVASSCG